MDTGISQILRMSMSISLSDVFPLLLLEQAVFGRKYFQTLEEEWCWVLSVIQDGSLTNTRI